MTILVPIAFEQDGRLYSFDDLKHHLLRDHTGHHLAADQAKDDCLKLLKRILVNHDKVLLGANATGHMIITNGYRQLLYLAMETVGNSEKIPQITFFERLETLL